MPLIILSPGRFASPSGVGVAGVASLLPVDQQPLSVSFANAVALLSEDAATPVKLADVVVDDDGLSPVSLTLSGDTVFEIIGSELWLVEPLDYEVASSHSCTVTATDAAGSASQDFTLQVADVFEATVPGAPTGVTVDVIDNASPTGVALSPASVSLPEDTDTTLPIKLADIVITDDGMGDNTIAVDNAKFVVVGTELFLAAGATLDYETSASESCVVSVVDSTVPGATAATDSFTLTITDVAEPPGAPTGVAVTVEEDVT